MSKFCEHCGAVMVTFENGKFDQATGHPALVEKCSAKPCKHSGCIFVKKPIVRRSLLLPWRKYPTYKFVCSVCGFDWFSYD